MEKRELRKKLSEIYCSLDEEYKKEASYAITQKVISLSAFKESKSIFIYLSNQNEPDTFSIIREAWRQGKDVYVPKCFSFGRMQAVRITDFDGLSLNKMGILEPNFSEQDIDLNFDITVVPCVSAWKDGQRLGHGGGYYDRFLENAETEKICICFEKLLSENIPMDLHDIYMDCVITENAIYRK